MDLELYQIGLVIASSADGMNNIVLQCLVGGQLLFLVEHHISLAFFLHLTDGVKLTPPHLSMLMPLLTFIA